MLRVRVDPALVRRMRTVADGRPLGQVASEALEQYVAAHEAEQEARGNTNQHQVLPQYGAGAPAAPDPRSGMRR